MNPAQLIHAVVTPLFGAPASKGIGDASASTGFSFADLIALLQSPRALVSMAGQQQAMEDPVNPKELMGSGPPGSQRVSKALRKDADSPKSEAQQDVGSTHGISVAPVPTPPVEPICISDSASFARSSSGSLNGQDAALTSSLTLASLVPTEARSTFAMTIGDMTPANKGNSIPFEQQITQATPFEPAIEENDVPALVAAPRLSVPTTEGTALIRSTEAVPAPTFSNRANAPSYGQSSKRPSIFPPQDLGQPSAPSVMSAPRRSNDAHPPTDNAAPTPQGDLTIVLNDQRASSGEGPHQPSSFPESSIPQPLALVELRGHTARPAAAEQDPDSGGCSAVTSTGPPHEPTIAAGNMLVSPSIAIQSEPQQTGAHAQAAVASTNSDLHMREALAHPVNSSPASNVRILDHLDYSEMHLGVRTQSFGSVEVHAVVHESQVRLAIASDSAELRHYLSTEAPVLAGKLERHDLQLQNIEFAGAGLSLQSGLWSGADPRSRGSPHTGNIPPHPASSIVADPPSADAEQEGEPPSRGLSIRV